MTLRLFLTPRAVQDLDEIWDYTAERWGVEQAETYLGDLRDTLHAALDTPTLLRACHEVREGYSRIVVGSHVAFARVEGGRLTVVRILHRRMDFAKHL